MWSLIFALSRSTLVGAKYMRNATRELSGERGEEQGVFYFITFYGAKVLGWHQIVIFKETIVCLRDIPIYSKQ